MNLKRMDDNEANSVYEIRGLASTTKMLLVVAICLLVIENLLVVALYRRVESMGTTLLFQRKYHDRAVQHFRDVRSWRSRYSEILIIGEYPDPPDILLQDSGGLHDERVPE